MCAIIIHLSSSELRVCANTLLILASVKSLPLILFKPVTTIRPGTWCICPLTVVPSYIQQIYDTFVTLAYSIQLGCWFFWRGGKGSLSACVCGIITLKNGSIFCTKLNWAICYLPAFSVSHLAFFSKATSENKRINIHCAEPAFFFFNL